MMVQMVESKATCWWCTLSSGYFSFGRLCIYCTFGPHLLNHIYTAEVGNASYLKASAGFLRASLLFLRDCDNIFGSDGNVQCLIDPVNVNLLEHIYTADNKATLHT